MRTACCILVYVELAWLLLQSGFCIEGGHRHKVRALETYHWLLLNIKLGHQRAAPHEHPEAHRLQSVDCAYALESA